MDPGSGPAGRLVNAVRSTIVAALLCVLVSGCATPVPTPQRSASSSPIPSLASISTEVGIHLINGTSLTVSVVVNDQQVMTTPPATTAMVDLGVLPSGPWTVEARSPSGRLLATVKAAAITADASAGDVVDFSCGRLILWAGGPVPDAPVVPSPFASGDCGP